VLVAPFVGLFYLPDAAAAAWATFAIFVLAAVTDFFDGWLARRLGVTSEFGRIFDPIADKLLVAAALIMLTAEGRAAAIAVALILVREMLISGIREGLAGRLALPVSWVGKWKTTAQMAAIGLLLIAPALVSLTEPLALAGDAALWLAAALSWLSALLYLRGLARQWPGS
jgi:cardiolipin synthase